MTGAALSMLHRLDAVEAMAAEALSLSRDTCDELATLRETAPRPRAVGAGICGAMVTVSDATAEAMADAISGGMVDLMALRLAAFRRISLDAAAEDPAAVALIVATHAMQIAIRHDLPAARDTDLLLRLSRALSAAQDKAARHG